MKRFAWAGLLALAATFAAQQQASAGNGCGWYWKGNIGLNLSWDACMGTYSNPSSCPPYGCPPSYCYPQPGYGYVPPAPYGYGYDPSAYYQGYAAQNYAAPQYATQPQMQQPAAPAPQQPATTTQIGYYPYASYGYNYNYGYGYNYGYQAPSYWYGR